MGRVSGAEMPVFLVGSVVLYLQCCSELACDRRSLFAGGHDCAGQGTLRGEVCR